MRCLTISEISEWLTRHGITSDPYDHPEPPSAHYAQIKVPGVYLRVEAFMRQYLAIVSPNRDLLLHIMDWETHTSGMIVIDSMRAHHGESRNQIDAPGHLFGPTETEHAIAMFSLCASFGWQCYLYSTEDQSTLLNWEGEIFDFWTGIPESLAKFQKLAKTFGFSEIPDPLKSPPSSPF